MGKEASFICRIRNENEHETALILMEELIEEYDLYRPLIEILSRSIDLYENESITFKKFNAKIKSVDSSIAVLKILMDQNQLGVSDFPEIGSKSLVSKILHGKRRLTVDHINALCKRFGIEPAVFF
ncbi:MAG: hypothetical protein A3E84_04160 [Gammaproteobacteria bacterium RIFCSPHIGHO2_12_FULL_42_13]|nr:MAG: hypothetical protein A3E84_04160 [Gammaproteobacteria bacterium RIFCSPHIGHO2_12_FULL_42_13]